MRFSKCPVCDKDQIKKFDYRDDFFKIDLFKDKKIECCENCGMSWIDQKIPSKELKHFYQNVYRSKNSPMFFDFQKEYLLESQFDSRSYAQILLGMQYLENKQEYNFLDIGPGPGNSFACIKKVLKNTNLYAIESNLDASDYYVKSTLDINICRNVEEINHKIDFLLMSHSLEHFDIKEIPKLFCSFKNFLSKGAVVVIELPNDDFRNIKHIKNRLNDSPHLTFFSLQSAQSIFEKFGFNITFCNTCADIYSYQAVQKTTKSKLVNFLKDLTLKFKIKSKIKILNQIIYPPNLKELLISSDFNYGGADRSCLRIVLKNN